MPCIVNGVQKGAKDTALWHASFESDNERDLNLIRLLVRGKEEEGVVKLDCSWGWTPQRG